MRDIALSVAYLDPGTGTMIVSAIVAVFATLALGFKTCWYKIARLLRRGKTNAPNPVDPDAEAQPVKPDDRRPE